MGRVVTIASMRRSLWGIIENAGQTVADVGWWNKNRPECGPLDCEVERVIVSKARKALAALDGGRMQEYGALTDDMARYAEQNLGRGKEAQ